MFENENTDFTEDYQRIARDVPLLTPAPYLLPLGTYEQFTDFVGHLTMGQFFHMVHGRTATMDNHDKIRAEENPDSPFSGYVVGKNAPDLRWVGLISMQDERGKAIAIADGRNKNAVFRLVEASGDEQPYIEISYVKENEPWANPIYKKPYLSEQFVTRYCQYHHVSMLAQAYWDSLNIIRNQSVKDYNSLQDFRLGEFLDPDFSKHIPNAWTTQYSRDENSQERNQKIRVRKTTKDQAGWFTLQTDNKCWFLTNPNYFVIVTENSVSVGCVVLMDAEFFNFDRVVWSNQQNVSVDRMQKFLKDHGTITGNYVYVSLQVNKKNNPTSDIRITTDHLGGASVDLISRKGGVTHILALYREWCTIFNPQGMNLSVIGDHIKNKPAEETQDPSHD